MFGFNENFLQDKYPIASSPCKHDILKYPLSLLSLYILCLKKFPSEMEGLASEEATIKLYSRTFLLHTTFISVGSLEGQN